jgi:primosomal replication protein N
MNEKTRREKHSPYGISFIRITITYRVVSFGCRREENSAPLALVKIQVAVAGRRT